MFLEAIGAVIVNIAPQSRSNYSFNIRPYGEYKLVCSTSDNGNIFMQQLDAVRIPATFRYMDLHHIFAIFLHDGSIGGAIQLGVQNPVFTTLLKVPIINKVLVLLSTEFIPNIIDVITIVFAHGICIFKPQSLETREEPFIE